LDFSFGKPEAKLLVQRVGDTSPSSSSGETNGKLALSHLSDKQRCFRDIEK